jgi:hypothetical protein
MTAEPAPDLIRMLEESRLDVQDAVNGLTEAEAAAAPHGGGWSALQCLEHVAFVEDRFLARLAAATRPEAPVASRSAEIEGLMTDRSRRLTAPNVVEPSGRYATMAAAMEAFGVVRARSLQIASEQAGELPLLSVEHPRLGVMSGVGLMVVIAGHARRHAAQIRELRGK